MTAATANVMTKSRNLGAKRAVLCADGTSTNHTIYAGTMVMLNSAGLAVAAAAAASNQGVCGVATEKKVVSDAVTYIIVQEGEFLFAGDTLAQTDVGLKVYADDDNTIDETQASNCPVAGVLTEVVSASLGWVKVGMTEALL